MITRGSMRPGSSAAVDTIHFADRKRPRLGVEILTYQSLLQRGLQETISSKHRLDFFQIILFTKGRGMHAIDGGSHTFRRGTVFLVGRGRVQRFSVVPEAQGQLLVFTPEFAVRYFSEPEIARTFSLFDETLGNEVIQLNEADTRSMEVLFGQVREEYDLQEATDDQQALLRAAVQFILLRLQRLAPERSNAPRAASLHDMRRFKEILAAQWRTCRSVEAYAAQLRIPLKKLAATTKATMGRSPKQCIQDHVVLEIQRTLMDERLSIKEVSFHCGFDEPTNLVKYLKKATGRTPTEYRDGLV